MIRAVGYARISKDDTLEGRGVGRQSEDIAAVCKRHRWTLAEVLVDNDVSASRYSRKARPGYLRLVEMIKTGSVDRAVVYDVDRLLRQPRQLEDLIDACEARNGAFQLHNVNGELDLATGGGRFIARMLVAKAAMESDDLSRRLKRAFDEKATEGRPHGARAFGYEPDGITVRTAEAELLRQAATDVLAGASLNTIARRWNADGVQPSQRAKQWTGTAVKVVLTGPHQAGLRRHRGEVIGPGAWPAVIDRATHDRLVAHLNRPHPRVPPRRTAFTGLVVGINGVPLDRDVVRGRAMYRGHPRPGRVASPTSIAAEPLENLIAEMLFAAVENDELGRHMGRTSAEVSAPDLAGIEDDLRGLAEDFGNGTIGRGEWMAARVPLEQRRDAALAALESEQRNHVHEAITVDLRATWPTLDVDRKRAILAAVFERIVIHPATQRGGPQPMVEGIGRIAVERVEPIWRA